MINERQLEDFICKNPEYSLWEGVEVIGRQVSLAHGRLDILAWDGSQTLVIELKARAIQEKDVGQVLRYRRDIESGLDRIGVREYPEDVTLRPKLFNELWTERHGLSTIGRYAISPILIGANIDSKTLAAARGGEILVILWRYESTQNAVSFSRPLDYAGSSFSDSHWNSPYPWWLRLLNERIKKSCEEECWEVSYRKHGVSPR